MKNSLTNEKLRQVLKKNSFELVHSAILVGYSEIKAGHEVELSSLLDQMKKDGIESSAKEN